MSQSRIARLNVLMVNQLTQEVAARGLNVDLIAIAQRSHLLCECINRMVAS